MQIEHFGRVATTASLLVALLACGGGGDDAAPATPGVAMIGAAGGTVLAEDGAQIVFPKDALRSDITVRIAKDSTGAPPLPPSAVAAGAVYTITPHGSAFEELVEVSIPVAPADSAGDGQVLLETAEPGDTQWRVLSGASYYDGRMRAPVQRFSFFQTIRLVNQIMPTLVTKIDGANNIGGTGIARISALANLPFPNRPGQANVPVNSLVAELSFPSLITQSGTTTIRGVAPAAATPSTTCRPVDYGHNAMSFRFSREGGQEFAPQVGHRAVVPRDPWPRFPGDGGALTFTKNTTIRSGFTGFGAIHYYGNESPRIAGFHDANPPTQAQIDAVVASQNRDYPPPEILPIGNVYALPTASDNAADNLYTWNGDVWWQPAQNGSVRIDAAIMTTCGLLLEAVPIAFRLAAPPEGRSHRYTVPDGYSYWNEVAEGSDVSMYFGLRNGRDWAFNDTGVTYRVDYSPAPTTVAWQPIPASAVTRESFQAFELPGQSQTSLVHGVRVSLAAVQASQAGYYRVFTCSVDGCFDGPPAQLVVLRSVPSISAQPGGQTVQVGETASFTVATAGAPLPALQWQKRSLAVALFGSQAWTNIDGATAATYTTPPLALGDNATQYRVWASNALGGLASDIAMLTVVERFLPPVIGAQPGNLNVTVGGTAVFAATVSGAGPLSYQWRRNGSNITGANAPILTLANVTALNDGRYELVISNRAGSVTTEPAVLQVTLGTPLPLAPTIAAAPASITVAEGNAANFAVAVTGTGPYTYLWMKNGIQAPIPNGDFPSFSIASVSAADAGTYSVRVTNNAGTAVSAAATLTVGPATGTGTPLAPAIVTAPAALAVLPGGGATFAVAVSGTAPFSYQWRRNGVDIAGATGAVLHIAAVNALDAGQYAVEVRNAAGATSSTAVALIVIGAPVITAQPSSAAAVEGSTARFDVSASGDATRYQWTRNNVGIVGATAASYTTPTLAAADNGAVYAVIVYNGAGLVMSQGAALTVSPPPAPTQWQTPAAIETDDTGDAQQPSIAVNAAGEAVVVWMQPGGGIGINIWANRYSPAGGWGTAQRISDGQGGAQGAQAVALDASGNAIAVWQQSDSIWANRYTAAGGWGTPQLIETSSGWAGNPQVGMDADGNALAVWWQREGARINIEAARYLVGDGWGAPEIIENDDSGDVSAPQIAVDAAGNAVAVWPWSADTGGFNFVYSVWANRYVAGVGWSSATPIESNNTQQPNPAPQVALDAGGNAIAVWHRNVGGFDSVMSSRYTAGVGWGSALPLVTDPTVVSRNARVAIDPAGNALAVWEQYVGATANVMASRRAAGAGWEESDLIETDNAGSAATPQIVIDANGVGTAMWSQRNAAGFTFNVWTNRYVPGSGWGTAVAIDGQPGPARSPALGVDAAGRIVAVWEQTVGSWSHLWASLFR